jgi:formylglycine-generating enzyme required for sulfatase activity
VETGHPDNSMPDDPLPRPDPSSLKGLTMALGFEPAEPGHDPLLGRDIGGVTLVRLIAEGGMGRVYEGLQEKPRRPVAVKVIRPGFVSSQLARRFHLEIEVLARLQHPFIAQIYSAGMCDVVGAKIPFFVMEFVPDALTITRYAEEKALSTKERLALFRKMCEAVAHGHHNGIIHRDLKPGNILIDGKGTPKVIDFGVARCINAKPEQMTALTDMGQLIGTLQYMSPEQIASDPAKIDVRTDVYALGVVLYELLTGQRPYEISQQQIFEAMRVMQESKPVAPSRLNREVPPEVEQIAGKCLYKNHEQRFANAAALADAIESYLGGGRVGANDPGWNSTVDDVFEHMDKKPTFRQRAVFPAVLIAAALLACGLIPWRAHTPSQQEWWFKRAADLAAFETSGDVEPMKTGGVRLGDGIGYAAILTKEEFSPPLRVEFDVVAGEQRLFDIFPGLFVKPINTRAGIQYLFGDNANTRSSVLLFGRQIPVAHEPIEAGRVYRIVFEVDESRKVLITRDGTAVYEGSLPDEAELRGPVQCGGGYGDITYKRLSIAKQLAEKQAAWEAPPGEIVLNGIGESATLQGVVPKGWLKPGVFAEIRGAGEARFPQVFESAYVLDIDVEVRNPRGCISFHIGEFGSGLHLPLGSLWPKDTEQDRVPSRLFRVQPWGVNWNGDAFFNTKERLSLKLVVLDDDKALVWKGKTVLRATGNAADFCLNVVASPDTDATIHRLICRAPTQRDASEAGLERPQRVLNCDVAATGARMSAEVAKTADRIPRIGHDVAIADRELLLRWIEPGELVLGDPKAPYPQLGLGQEKVTISSGYWMAAHEVTQRQWKALLKSDPSRITGSPYLPVNNVTWTEACRFCEQLTAQERQAGRCPPEYEYRLPTEAEWEWACLAGTHQSFTIPERQRPVRERYRSLVEAGTTPANRWGLHEMLGNVPEWCLDSWQDYTGNIDHTVIDRLMVGKTGQEPLVVRGGGVWFDESASTSFARTKRHDVPGGFRGFRVALGPVASKLGLERIVTDDTE